MKDNKDLITVAEIVRPQGIKGEVKIKALTDSADRFSYLREVIIGKKTYEIENVRISPSGIFISFKGVSDRDAAEGLRGKFLQISRAEAVRLPDGKYFIVDLIGCEVRFHDSVLLGTLSDIL